MRALALLLLLLVLLASDVARAQASGSTGGAGQSGDANGQSGGAAGTQPGGAGAQPGSAAGRQPGGIVPPQQTFFVQAPYPTAALRQKIEGVVVLRLTIDAQGQVSDAQVERGAGHGFDQAAQQAALRFRFTPAQKDGRPMAAVILYRYRFTLKRAPPRPAVKKTIPKAMVTVKVTVGSGVVAGAVVTLSGPDGQVTTQMTGEDGVARFPTLTPGAYQITADASGYQTAVHEEKALPGRETRATYSLVPSEEGLEVVVRGEPRRDVTVRRITGEEAALVPGGAGDPIRVLESLPGVVKGDKSGELLIRGANPFFSGVFIDGMPVPFLYHIYDVASVVPADMVEDVTLYPGNFGVRYGRYIGGIVEVGMQSPNTRCTADYGRPINKKGCYHGLLQLDLLEGRAMVEGPLPGTERWSFALSARRSWIDYLIAQAVKQTDLTLEVAPRYYDAYAMVEYKDRRQKLSLRGYTSKDELALIVPIDLGEDVTSVGRFELDYGFDRLQALYENHVDDQTKLSATVGGGRDFINLFLDELEIEQQSVPLVFRQEVLTRPHPVVGLNLGTDLFVSPYDLRIKAPETAALTPTEDKSIHGTDATFAAYAELPLRPTGRAEVTPGVRVDHTPTFSETTVSPRLLARYDLLQRPKAESLKRTTLKGGVGLYHQAPPVVLRFIDEAADPQSMRAFQYSVGLEQELTKEIDASVEAYYIDRSRLFSTAGRADGTTRIKNEGTGETIGLETFLRYRSDKRFFGWIAYTLSRTVEREKDGEPSHLANFDQTHNLIVVGSYNMGRGWRFGGRFRYVSGVPFTDIARKPFAPSLFYGATGEYIPQTTAINAERLPPIHQLDLRVDKRWQYRAWALTAYLDVRNVYNHRAARSYDYNYDFTQREPSLGVFFLPIVGVKGEF